MLNRAKRLVIVFLTHYYSHPPNLNIIGRVSKALCLFLGIFILIGCAPNLSCGWEYHEIRTKNPAFNGGRLILCTDLLSSNLELEMIRSASGIKMFLNILTMQALPCPDDPQRTSISIQFFDDEDAQEIWSIRPYILEGGQRLLFPDNAAERLIQALIDERSFDIKIGKQCLRVISDNFSDLYPQLMSLSID